MTRRHALVVTTVASLAALLLIGASAGAQEAGPVGVTVDQVGWWTARPAATATEDGGFEVATNGAGEAQSVAAAQLTIAADAVDSFSITLTESSAFAEFGSIAVCRTVGLWIAENPGTLEDAPEADCSTRVNLTRTTDDGTWLGDITPLVRDGGMVSLAFVPEYRPPTPLGPGMVVRIAEIGTEATGTAATPDTTAPTTTSQAPATTVAPAGPSSGTQAPPTPPPTAAPAAPTGAEALPSPTTTVYDTQPIAEDEEFFTLGPVEQGASESKPWFRLLLLVPLSAALGAGAVRIRRVVDERTHLSGTV